MEKNENLIVGMAARHCQWRFENAPGSGVYFFYFQLFFYPKKRKIHTSGTV
jgi:hypothetical protein